MRKTFTKVITSALAATAFIVGALGCGSASNNDQGVSFSAIGFAAQDDDGACTLDIGTTGVIVPITFGTVAEDFAISGIISCILLQNNMSSQSVRVERLYLSYHIPGASEQPPDTSIPLSVVLSPLNQEAPLDGGGSGGGDESETASADSSASGSQDEASTDPDSSIGGSTAKTSSLPSGFQGFGNRVSAPFFSVPPEIRQWLAFNRTALPETPFVMEITVYAQGMTSGGDRMNTNPLSLFADVIEDRIIPPDEGSADSEDAAAETDSSDSGDSGFVPSGDSFSDNSSGTDSDSTVDGDTGDASGGGSSDQPVEQTL